MLSLVTKIVEETILRHGMIRPGNRIIVAVSGGGDSIVLLHILYCLSKNWDFNLIVAHLNHGLRGCEGEEDAKFVAEYATSLNLPSVLEKADVRTYCKKNQCSIEQGAREVRYDFLKRVLLEQNGDSVATGHTANDQAETVLMRLLRGCGSSGLSSIRPIRNGWIIRPLLEVPSDEISDYIQKHGLSFRSDSSNANQAIFRNKIRHHLIPFLEQEYNPKIREGLGRLAEVIRNESEYLEGKTRKLIKSCICNKADGMIRLNIDNWGETAPAIQRIFIRYMVREVGGNEEILSFDHIENMCKWIKLSCTGQIYELPGKIRIEKRKNSLVICRFIFDPYQISLELPGSVNLPGINSSININEYSIKDIPNSSPTRAIFDADVVSRKWIIRSREAGDRILSLGLNGSKSVKKIFNEHDVPRLIRNGVPIVTCGATILWVVGFRQSTIGMVTQKTKRVIVAELVSKNRCNKTAPRSHYMGFL